MPDTSPLSTVRHPLICTSLVHMGVIPFWLIVPIAAVGGLIAVWNHVPAGAMVGALIAVAATSLATGRSAAIPKNVSFAGRALLGTVIGSAMNRHTLEVLGSAIVPTIVISFALLGASVGIAMLVARIAKLDRATAICSFTPGGMGEMTSIAQELGADMRVVAALHVLRLVLILVIVPIAVLIVLGRG
ncbi:MAG: AbrB family transcriptional regulator [Chloroflexota bacterium]